MTGIFKWIGNCIMAIGRIAVLPFLKARTSSRLQFVLRWFAHFICLGLIVAGLFYLNYSMRLDTVLLAPSPLLRMSWLPLLFVQLYVLSWFGWWLCHLLTSRKNVGEHPDIDRAWSQVETALSRASIDLTKSPLYLLIGKPENGLTNFFNAGQIVRTVSQVPTEEGAPIQVFANEESVYICCEDTSLLGRQSMLFAEATKLRTHREFQTSSATRFRKSLPSEPVVADEIQVTEEGSDVEFEEQPTAHFDQDLGGGTLTKTSTTQTSQTAQLSASIDSSIALLESNIALAESLESKLELEPETETVYQPTPRIQLPLLQNDVEIDTAIARLEYLCKVVETARAPFCPINGIVVLIPFVATESDELANHTGMLIEQDLETIAASASVDAPRIAVFCDLQHVPGCVELLDRFPEEQRHRRLGVRFPRIPACDRDQMSQMIKDGMGWLCQHMIPPLVNRLFQTERTGGGAEESVNEANKRLYRFMFSLRGCQTRFERLIRRAFLGDDQKGELLRGCYLAASGKDSLSEQGFTAGIFNQILEMQNDVAWTREALSRDEDFRRWTTIGYCSVATITIVALLMIFL